MVREQTGFIIVRLSDAKFGTLLHEQDDLRELAREASATDLQSMFDDYQDFRVERVVRSVRPERILELERLAASRGFPRKRSLNSYWRMDARKADTRQEWFERLAKLESVDATYYEAAGSDPQVNASDDVFAIQQFHLHPAPIGVDAEWAWTQPNGSGDSVGFVDLEQGWNLDHEDLPAIASLPGVSQDINTGDSGSHIRHGTADIGIAVGVDNSVGIIGVAPEPAWVGIASHFRDSDGTSGHVADALTAVLASGALSEGDVVLIEYQYNNQPAETDPAVWTAIELATALGIVVVEAAGNGNGDLDIVPELNRNNPATFQDSRAIIVAAGKSALDPTNVGHDRWVLVPPPPPPIPQPGSNWGSRVDCYAHGENVVTAGPTPNAGHLLAGTGPNDSYRDDFGGTSAAAAIVAGATVVLQGLHKHVKGQPLDPVAMRNILSTAGTPQGPAEPGRNIGILPDLKKAAGQLGLRGTGAPSAPTNVRTVS